MTGTDGFRLPNKIITTRLRNVLRNRPIAEDPLVNLLLLPPAERDCMDIEQARAKARKLSVLFANMDNCRLDYVLKLAEINRYTRDKLVVKEGDRGSTFYLIVSGKVSVFVLQQANKRTKGKGSNEALVDYPSFEELSIEEVETILRKTKRRDILGKCYASLGKGLHFGELALLSQDGIRNATVVADEDCILLVFNKELYDTTVKVQQKLELEQKHKFANSHPFFASWNERSKRQLVYALEHRKCGFGEEIIAQSNTADKLHFIVSGEARIITVPGRHKKQVFLDSVSQSNEKHTEEEDTKPEKQEKAESTQESDITIPRLNQDSIPLPYISDVIGLRRINGYVAAERKSFDRIIDLCFVRTGEVLGDTEFLAGVGSYLFTVKCITECELFSVAFKTMERLLSKRSPQATEFMYWSTETKLLSRMSSEQGKKVPILAALLLRLQEEKSDGKFSGRNGDGPRGSHGVGQNLSSKTSLHLLPSQKAQLKQITKLFMQNKFPLLIPYTNGAVYYRELSRKRAQIRAEQREMQHVENHLVFPSLQRQLSDAKIEKHREEQVYCKRRQRLMSKGNIEQIDIYRWKR